MQESIQKTIILSEAHHQKRLDQALASLLPEYSRNLIKQWILKEHVLLDGKPAKPKDKVTEGQNVSINATLVRDDHFQPQAIALDILFEDDHLMIINKPVGLVVHPGAGNKDQTLLNALLHHNPEANQLPRAGIIHRIDKDTSGCLVIAKTLPAYTALNQAMQAKEIQREYKAIVYGALISGRTIDHPIGRHPTLRTKMAVTEQGKPAVTHYRIAEKFPHFTLIHLTLETGRTHQIRVHMSHIGHPILGDKTYIRRAKYPKGATEAIRHLIDHVHRQALHAFRLTLTHPITQEALTIEAPMPDDMQAIINVLSSKK